MLQKDKKNFRRFLCTDNSMSPVLLENDILFFKKLSFQRIQINDILIIRKNSKYFSRRVIYKTSSYIITKGDNISFHDGKIYPKEILGKIYKGDRNSYSFNPSDIYLSQSFLYLKEVGKLNQLFKKEKIDFLFLKGIPLYLYIEKKNPQRIYADCDILIKKSQLQKVDELLRKRGYTRYSTELSTRHKRLKDKETEIAYYKIDHGIPIILDVHVEVVFMMNQIGKLDLLYPQNYIDRITKVFLQKKLITKINNKTYPILSSTHLLYYLALHIFHHNFRGYNRYDFFDSVFKSNQVNYKELTSLIINTKVENFIYPVFLIYKKYYNSNLSDKFLKTITPKNRWKYIYHYISTIDIFEDESQLKAGVNRFIFLVLLSPEKWIKKIFVFSQLIVFISIVLVFWKNFQKMTTFLTTHLSRIQVLYYKASST